MYKDICIDKNKGENSIKDCKYFLRRIKKLKFYIESLMNLS